MDKEISPDWVVAMLAAQGVKTDAARAATHASLLGAMLKGAASGYARLAFEEEPAGFAVEQRRNAP